MPMSKRATLRDVARRAGVSISTASRALADHPDIGAPSKAKVMAASRDLEYRPSMLARGLVGKQTNTVGLLVSDITNPFYPQLASSIESLAHRNNYAVYLANTGDDPEWCKEYVGRLLALAVDGIVYASVRDGDDLEELLSEGMVPIVFANRRPSASLDVDLVVADNRGGGLQAARHLVELGHRHVAFVAGPAYASVSQERYEGFAEGLAVAGLSPLGGMPVQTDFTRPGGYQAAKELLKRRMRPTAIFAVNDIVALGVLDAALDMGLTIPDDLSVIGFDNIEPVGLGPLRLTTVSVPIREMGEKALELLWKALNEGETHQPQQVILETTLVVRHTTSPPADLPPENWSSL